MYANHSDFGQKDLTKKIMVFNVEKHVFDKDELIEEVKKETDIGKKIVKAEMEFLKDIDKLIEYVLEKDKELFEKLSKK